MKILNFGSCNIDYVYSLDHIVANGETESTQKLETFCGGKGLNQSIALKKAGAEVYHAGCIGEGGDFLMDFLRENGVDVTFLKRIREKNGHAIIQVAKNGDNSIFLYPGSNRLLTKAHVDEVLSFFGAGDFLLLQNEINELSYLVDRAYALGMNIILNPSPYNEAIDAIDLEKLSYLILNEIEAKEISGSASLSGAMSFFRERFPRLKVVMTLGKRGSIYRDAQTQVLCPSFYVETVDTTAAGDTFTGYFTVGIAQGRAVKDALTTASCAAAISVTRNGAAPSIPSMAEVEQAEKVLARRELNSVAERFLLEQTDAYLEAHLADATLEGLAEALGYSAVYTGVLLKRMTGGTYKSYLQKKRLMCAERLLRESEQAVSEIIHMVGYDNESYFRKIFKQQYGQNPLQYRKKEGNHS